MGIIIGLALCAFLLWLGFRVTGAMLSAAVWLFIKLPFAIIIACLGLTCYMTILLIPVGGMCLSLAGRILFG